MHASSMENMRRCIEWYLPADPGLTIVDLGSKDIDGSYRSLLPSGLSYIGVDLEQGPGVDIVLNDPYVLPFDDASVDVVISGQMLAHRGQFWRIFAEVKRVLKLGGLAFIIAPSSGPVRRGSVDCYRFHADSYAAIAEWAGLRLVHSWSDERGPWREIVGVFQSGGVLSALREPTQPLGALQTYQGVLTPEHEATSGTMSYLDVLSQIHQQRPPRRYLEIGIRHGSSLALAKCEAVAVDPYPSPKLQLPRSVSVYAMTSDDFFFFKGDVLKSKTFDLAFIDGMHLCEFVLRDFMNVEQRMSKAGIIVVDDIFPNHPLQASRNRQSRVWTGDVWRFAELLPRYRPDLKLIFLDTFPTGLLVIANLDPKSTVLWQRYNHIAKVLQRDLVRQPAASVLGRCGASDPQRFVAELTT